MDLTTSTELARSLVSNSAFAPPKTILQAIPDELAHAVPVAGGGRAPHSIYAEVWHMAFWQQISLEWIAGTPTPQPGKAAEGFPSENARHEEPWAKLRERFLAGAEAAAAAANDAARLDSEVFCPTTATHIRPALMTVREQLESLAAHNSYHLGRIVLLRQLLGAWPPPDGGYSW